MEYKINYSSNNSGGDWWLSDKDWKTLSAKGWIVDWRTNDEGLNERWLGAVATCASLNVKAKSAEEAAKIAVGLWEDVVYMDASDNGCTCCGPLILSFSVEVVDDDEELSYCGNWYGDEIAELMTGCSGLSYREALVRVK